jgi:hypothetical protein
MTPSNAGFSDPSYSLAYLLRPEYFVYLLLLLVPALVFLLGYRFICLLGGLRDPLLRDTDHMFRNRVRRNSFTIFFLVMLLSAALCWFVL